MAVCRDIAAQTYRRIEFDARVSGADQRELVVLLLGELAQELRTAVFAHETGHASRKSGAITRAISILTTLELGVVRGVHGTMADHLLTFYRASKYRILDSVIEFDAAQVQSLRADVDDIGAAFSSL